MAKAKATGKRAASYIRMSTDRQEDSPQSQRKTALEYITTQGFHHVREFDDEGISGVDTAARPGFQAMMAAAGRREFDAIIVRDQDRFGRFTPKEFMYWMHHLDMHGVELHSVTKGHIRADDIGDCIVGVVDQYANHDFSKKISTNVTRAMIERAKQGHPMGSTAYGYARQYRDQKGKIVHHAKRGERCGKVKGWTSETVLSQDESEVETVRRIFEWYVNSDNNYWTIVKRLNDGGVPSPNGNKLWNVHTVRMILRNVMYIGHQAYGKESYSKFNSCGLNGEMQAKQTRHRSAGAMPILVENTHPPIVSKELFEAAQRKIAKRSYSKHKPREGGCLLTGLLHCGNCGYPMYGARQDEFRQSYYCSGCRARATCRPWRLKMGEIDAKITELVLHSVLSEGNVAKITDKLNRQAAKNAGTRDVERLEVKVKDLGRKLSNAEEKWAVAESDLQAPLLRITRSLKVELNEARQQLAAAKRAVAAPKQTAEKVRQLFEKLKRGLSKSPTPTMRHALRQVIERIDAEFENATPTSYRGEAGNLKYIPTVAKVRLLPTSPVMAGATLTLDISPSR